MKFGICHLSVVPVRPEPSDKSEMISQLLFGETFQVTADKQNWIQIEGALDGYKGWIDKKQCEALTKKSFETIQSGSHYIALELVQSAIGDNIHQPILIGSTLPFYDGINFLMDSKKFMYSGQAVLPYEIKDTKKLLPKVALKYLNAPYLWGGRSPFGIDCSGLTQIVFKILGINIPRDAYQQAETGNTVNMINESTIGDLAFFDNKERRITHVGIILGDNQIIHASGRVRIDKIDQVGIFNESLKKYTHKLRIIKRVF